MASISRTRRLSGEGVLTLVDLACFGVASQLIDLSDFQSQAEKIKIEAIADCF